MSNKEIEDIKHIEDINSKIPMYSSKKRTNEINEKDEFNLKYLKKVLLFLLGFVSVLFVLIYIMTLFWGKYIMLDIFSIVSTIFIIFSLVDGISSNF